MEINTYHINKMCGQDTHIPSLKHNYIYNDLFLKKYFEAQMAKHSNTINLGCVYVSVGSSFLCILKIIFNIFHNLK